MNRPTEVFTALVVFAVAVAAVVYIIMHVLPDMF